jgi:hypothetical protein
VTADPTVPQCNPFVPAPTAADGSPLPFDPAWRTATVLALTRAIEGERNYTRMPILADALEEAGCDVPEVLDHCRRCDGHSRDCWVMRLILDRDPLPVPLHDPEVIDVLRRAIEPSPALQLIRERLEGRSPMPPSSRRPLWHLLPVLGLFGLLGWFVLSNNQRPPPPDPFLQPRFLPTAPTFDHKKATELGELLTPKSRETQRE